MNRISVSPASLKLLWWVGTGIQSALIERFMKWTADCYKKIRKEGFMTSRIDNRLYFRLNAALLRQP